jgi:peptidoglycan hydrolase-like protein with peptidoglycan-binding domain
VSRGRRAPALGVGAAVAAGMVGAVIWMTQEAEAADAAGQASAPTSTADVEQRTLTVVEDLDGTLGHGGERTIGAGSPGTLTRLPDVGSTVERGGFLFEVNGAPTILLYGETPAWRTLAEGVGGPDVEQLEANLDALGYGDDLEIDETWDAATTAAVTAWQTDAGMAADGRVDLGEVVFEPDAVIIAGLEGSRGGNAGPGAPVLRVTGTERVITASLSASQRDGVEVGDTVEVELADGTLTDATVTEVDALPTTAQDGSQSYAMRLTLDAAPADATDGPVILKLVRQQREDVLAVPVNALLALLEGGYAVERVTDAGTTELVAVEVGLFADGWVEVRGEVAAGDVVVVP